MRRLNRAVSKASDGAFVVDEEYRIVYWNQKATSILGYTADQAVGRYCYELMGGHDEKGRNVCRRFCRIAVNARRGASPSNIDLLTSTNKRGRLWVNLSSFAYQPSEAEQGNVIVHLFRDVTRRINAERFADKIIEASRTLHSADSSFEVPNPPRETSPNPGEGELTRRERQVLLLLARGLGTAEIANALTISASTTRNHIQSILNKLGVHSRLEAVAHAYENGFIDAFGL